MKNKTANELATLTKHGNTDATRELISRQRRGYDCRVYPAPRRGAEDEGCAPLLLQTTPDWGLKVDAGVSGRAYSLHAEDMAMFGWIALATKKMYQDLRDMGHTKDEAVSIMDESQTDDLFFSLRQHSPDECWLHLYPVGVSWTLGISAASGLVKDMMKIAEQSHWHVPQEVLEEFMSLAEIRDDK